MLRNEDSITVRNVFLFRAIMITLLLALVLSSVILPVQANAAPMNDKIIVGVPNPDYYKVKPRKYQSKASLDELRANAREYWKNFLELDVDLLKWNQKHIDNEGVAAAAREITANCHSNSEKIRAVAYYVADNIYYDYDYYEGRKTQLYYKPQDVLKYKITVCEGYARLSRALLQSVGVPCIYASGPNHGFNAAWDGSRWVLFDSTWCSMNKYEYGKMIYSGVNMNKWYDYSFEFGLMNYNHIVDGLPIMINKGTLEICYSDAKSITISNVHTIGDSALSGFGFRYAPPNPTSVSFPNAETIGQSAFLSCSSLTSVSLPKAETIGKWAFDGCSSLTSVSLPNAKAIGEHVFDGCSSLTSVSLPNAKAIGKWAFDGCSSLTSLILPKLSEVGDRMFYSNKTLSTIDLSGATKVGEAAFMYCKSLTSVDLSNAETIGEDAFYGCASLTSVSLPNAVTIGEYAFSSDYTKKTNLTSVSLPKATYIGEYSFNRCTALRDIYIPLVEQIERSAFSGCNKTITFHVYKNSYGHKFAKQNKFKVAFITDPNEPTAIRIDSPTTVKLALGETLQLSYELMPTTASSSVTWKSSKAKVASVDAEGRVKALKVGTAKITVSTYNKKKAVVKVIVANN